MGVVIRGMIWVEALAVKIAGTYDIEDAAQTRPEHDESVDLTLVSGRSWIFFQ